MWTILSWLRRIMHGVIEYVLLTCEMRTVHLCYCGYLSTPNFVIPCDSTNLVRGAIIKTSTIRTLISEAYSGALFHWYVFDKDIVHKFLDFRRCLFKVFQKGNCNIKERVIRLQDIYFKNTTLLENGRFTFFLAILKG